MGILLPLPRIVGLLLVDYNFPALEVGQWVQVLVYLAFIISRYRRWAQLRNLSMGHKVIGQIMMIMLLIGLIFMITGPQSLTTIRVLVYGSLLVWDEFSYYYMNQLDIPERYLHPNSHPDEDEPLGIFDRERFIRFLLKDTDPMSFWEKRWVHNLLVALVALILVGFGFNRALLAYTEGYQKGTKTVEVVAKKSEVRTQQAVKQAVSEATDSIVSSASIAAGIVAEKALKDNKTILVNQKTIIDGLQKLGARKNVASATERVRPTYYVSPLHITTPKDNPLSPSKVKPVPPATNRRSRKLSLNETEPIGDELVPEQWVRYQSRPEEREK